LSRDRKKNDEEGAKLFIQVHKDVLEDSKEILYPKCFHARGIQRSRFIKIDDKIQAKKKKVAGGVMLRS